MTRKFKLGKYGLNENPCHAYQAANETPTLERAIQIGAVPADSTQKQWEALSPGMRREIVRSKIRRL